MSPKPTLTPSVEARNFSTTLQPAHRQQRGIAIITVLSVLLLMTVLILAFFKMAQSELEDAKLYSDGVRTTQLSEIVTNIVIGQIREATFCVGATKRNTWASQPGAIHRFGIETRGSGNDFRNMSRGIYKLYSSSSMFAAYSPTKTLATDVPGDWDERPAQYVDLNTPVYNSSSDKLYFPIIDPRGYSRRAREGKIQNGNLEGFSYSEVNSKNRKIAGVVEPGSGLDSQRLPMPVEWFYMLADGTLGTVDEEGKWEPNPLSSGEPSEKNPMVARLAFWTDDESSKININTASEGAFWDLPRADTKAERSYGQHQPARNEVYRYPGHVAGVSLSTILFPGTGASPVGAKPFLTESQYEDVLGLSPKARWYSFGSRIGDQRAASDPGTSDGGVKRYLPGSERLYATVDEMLYKVGNPGGNERQLNNIFEDDRQTRNYFEYGRHSLTVNSNAPEITAHGTPRVCLWPMRWVGSKPTGTIVEIAAQTYYDRLISFASTIGNRRYFWQRRTAGSRHGEIYNNADGVNIELLDYMIDLAGTKIPGYGGSFFDKYGGTPGESGYEDAREIVVQIWDYMRNTNLNDPLIKNKSDHYNQLDNSYPRSGALADRSSGVEIGRGQIAGSCLCGGTGPHQSRWWKRYSPYSKGHGRNFTLTEVAMVFYCRAHAQGNGIQGDQLAGEALEAGQKLIEVALVLETFCVAHGFTSIQPKSRIRVAARSAGGDVSYSPGDYPEYKVIDQEGIEWDFPPLARGLGTPGVMARWDSPQNYVGKRVWGGHGGVRLFSAELERSTNANLFLDKVATQRFPIDSNGNYSPDNLLVYTTRFYKDQDQVKLEMNGDKPAGAIIIKDSHQFMEFQGSPQPMALILYDEGRNGPSTVNNLIQVFQIAFDTPTGRPVKVPVPSIPDDGTPSTWEKRMRLAGGDVKKLISEKHDVTRSVMVTHGDFRLISGKRSTNKFVAKGDPDFAGQEEGIWGGHPAYDLDWTGAVDGKGREIGRHAHTLTAADGTKLPGFHSDRGYAIDKNGAPIAYPPNLAPDFAGDPKGPRFFPRSQSLGTADYELSVDPGVTGDWDNGIGPHIDGPYINRPDDGTSLAGRDGSPSDVPYFDNLGELDSVDPTFFSPNRVIPGAGQLGSLPTGIQAGIPWRTLLFRPDVEHFGARNYPRQGDPPDHAMMDFFWMPIVEPFPISQPFATMGKVNMNYQIAPFDYIKRATAMHAVMKDQRMLAIENNSMSSYKVKGSGGDYRFPIDIPVTLLQFEDRFNKGEIFRSASEICEIYMVPQGVSGAPSGRNTLGSPVRTGIGSKGYDYPTMREFWKGFALTGDNSKERTYTNLYPRLTTKSNVFQVHMTVQSLQKSRATEHDIFDPEQDKIVGTWRGSSVIERNIDPDKIKPNAGVPDYAQATSGRLHRIESMEMFYTYRVLNVKQFNP
jgi:hypothetical protein